MKKNCNNCRWFVKETETVGDYQHSEAVRKQSGFCLMQDLFTYVKPGYAACGEYNYEEEIKQ